MNLRPYQLETLTAVNREWAAGVNRQLVVLPTAAGKTVVFSHLPQYLRMRRPERMLVLVQSNELCYQAVEKLARYNPLLKIGLEKAEYRSAGSDDIVVASVQTLGGTKPDGHGGWIWGKRLERMDPALFTYIVVDEAHHCVAENYHGILRYFGVMKSDPLYNNPGKFLLGVTATPSRSDNKGLEVFFDKIVFSRDIRTMIREKWLADIRAFRVETMVSLDDVASRRGPNGNDYVTGQLERAVNTPERNKLIVDKYLELGEGLPFLAFTVDIQHTIDLAECFRERNILATGIAGGKGAVESPALVYNTEARKQAVRDYAAGKLTGLISCQALLEGFDAPNATVALCCRPTKSGLLYIQSIGRVLRPYPAPEDSAGWTGWRKNFAIVLDFVDNASTNASALSTVPTLFGLKPDFNMQGKKAGEVMEEVERAKQKAPLLNLSLCGDLDQIRGMASKIDLFAVPKMPPEIQKLSTFTWMTGLTEGSFQLVLPDTGVLRVQETTLGEFEVSRHINGVKTLLKVAANLGAAIRFADNKVPREATILLNNTSAWRNKPVSAPQVACLSKLYPEMRKPFRTYEEFTMFIHKSYTCGDVSSLIAARDKKR